MHESHFRNLITYRANIRRAISDNGNATIGGGSFSGDELLSLALAVESTLRREYENGSEHTRELLRPVMDRISKSDR